jgi:Intracellular proteinase inhibitor
MNASLSLTLVNHSGETVGAVSGNSGTADFALVNGAGRPVFRYGQHAAFAAVVTPYAVEPLASMTTRLRFEVPKYDVAPGRYTICAWFVGLTAYARKTVVVRDLPE